MKFSEYVEENEYIIARLKRQFSKRGIELSELELWQYVNWCHESVRQYLIGISPDAGRVLNTVTAAVADQNAAMFTGERTGVFPPPDPKNRFESPDEAQKLLDATKAKVTSAPVSASFEDLHDPRAARNYL